MLKKLTTLTLSYLATIALGFIAKTSIAGISLDFLWIAFLPLATFVSLTTFDLLLNNVDFTKETLNNLPEQHKSVYTIALAILSAGFAIALAIFLR
jgi:hypothetical protein